MFAEELHRVESRLTELAELAIGDDKLAESAESLERLVAVLLGSLLVDWCANTTSIASANVLGLPDELLEQVALVLGKKQKLGLLDDGAQIADQLLAVGRELLRWLLQLFPCESTVHRDINLLVLRTN